LRTRPQTTSACARLRTSWLQALVNPADTEELALTLNGKKRKINLADFIAAFKAHKLEPRQQYNILLKMEQAWPAWLECIEASFLSDDLKAAYVNLLRERFDSLSPLVP
jgi:hypothetical protein